MKPVTTLTRREELSTKLAVALMEVIFKNEAGEIQGIKATCLYAIVCADAMIEEFDKEWDGTERREGYDPGMVDDQGRDE